MEVAVSLFCKVARQSADPARLALSYVLYLCTLLSYHFGALKDACVTTDIEDMEAGNL